MKMSTQMAAQIEYKAAEKNLRKFCEKEADLELNILDGQYPIVLQFIPNTQLYITGNDNVDENGEVNDLTITVGLTTSVKSTLKFKMDAKLLKKLIKLSETVGQLYYHAFREEQSGRITAKPPVVLDDLDPETFYCPECGHKFTDAAAKPSFCSSCGQALNWAGITETEAPENE